MAVGDKLETVEIDGNIFQAVEVESSGNSCNGCTALFGGQNNLCSNLPHCTPMHREDNKEVIWVKLEKEESPPQAPTQKGVTILEVRESTRELRKKIYELVREFETTTQMLVQGISLNHTPVIAGASCTYDVELDVRLN